MKNSRRRRLLGIPVSVLTTAVLAPCAWADASGEVSVERGRYLAVTAGCNDCHTAGFSMANGQVPESDWLMGDNAGWYGPWGTTHATNLRISLSTKTEEQWLSYARNLRARPAMPWYVLNIMAEEDLRSLYRFIRQLQPMGAPAPAYRVPGTQPPQPYFELVAPPPPPAEVAQ